MHDDIALDVKKVCVVETMRSLTLLSSWVSHSGLKVWKGWLPWVQLENWKRLENVRLFSDVSGKMASWKLTPWGRML